jgi:hypothetical protein
MLAFLAAALASSGGRRLWRWGAKAAAAAVLVLAAGIAAAVGPIEEQLSETKMLSGLDGIRQRMTEIRTELSPPHERTGRVSPVNAQLVDYLTSCTEPQSRLLTLTFAPEIFFYSHRGFAGGQVAMTPGYFVGSGHDQEVLARLAHEDVPFVIMDSETQQEMAVHYAGIVNYVSGRYHEVGRLTVGPGKDLIVLADNNRPPRRMFGAAQLPCYTS